MKPLLASIVLLLLALCRPTSAAVSWSSTSTNSVSSTSTLSMSAPNKPDVAKSLKEDIEKAKGTAVDAAKIEELLNLISNPILAMLLDMADILEKMPDFFKNAIINGVSCNTKPEKLDRVKALATEVTFGNTYHRTKDEIGNTIFRNCDATVVAAIDANYKNDPGWICYCVDAEQKSGLYCTSVAIGKAVEKMGKPIKKCRDEALKDLKLAGQKALGAAYDLEGFDNKPFKEIFAGDASSIDKITENSKDEVTKFFCDALEPTVETAVKDLYAADALYWMAESAVLTVLFGPANQDLPTACKDADFSATDYGKCVCKMDTGFSFCVYKVLAEYFVKAGYLDCTAYKFDATKKAAVALPVVALKKADPAKGDTPSPSANVHPTSSLLMAPLMAAAALLV